MMKRVQARGFLKALSVVVTVALLVGGAPPRAMAAVNIVATLEHYGAIAKLIGGDRVNVSALVKGSQNPHSIAVKPSYSVLLNRADLLVTNGQFIEVGWLDVALTNARNLKIMEGQPGFVNCSLGVDIIPYKAEEIEGTPLFFLNLGAGGTLRLGNHHYWLDPANTALIARNIYEKLAAVDPANAEAYRGAYDQFTTALASKLKEWDRMMEPFKGMPIVTYHRSWEYLARRHGLVVFGYVEPKETLPPSAAHLASLVDRMKRSGVKVVLAEPYQNRQITEEVARLAGARALILPTSVSEDAATRTVFQLFDKIYQDLAQALQATRSS